MLMLLVQKLAGSTITKVVIVILFIHSPGVKGIGYAFGLKITMIVLLTYLLMLITVRVQR